MPLDTTSSAVEDLPKPINPDLHPEGECPWARFERAEHETWAYQYEDSVIIRDLAVAKSILSDRRFEQGGQARRSRAGVDPRFLERRQKSLLSREGPDHQRMRRIASKAAFTPRATDRYRPFMRTVMGELADRVPADGVCDAIPTLVRDYPSQVIALVLGSDAADADFLSPLVEAIFNAQAGHPPEAVAAALDAHETLDNYLLNLIDMKRADPGADLITDLVRAETEEGTLSTQEVLDIAVAVIMAGTDTTRNQLTHGLHLFAERPEAWERPSTDDSLETAVEEVLRFAPISHVLRRVATTEVVIDDLVIPEGTMIVLHAGAANRDPDAYEDPNEFDMARSTAPNNLALGHGRKFCLGANLAKAELVEALRVLRQRFVDIELAGPVPWRYVGFPRGARELPLRLTHSGSEPAGG